MPYNHSNRVVNGLAILWLGFILLSAAEIVRTPPNKIQLLDHEVSECRVCIAIKNLTYNNRGGMENP